MTSTTLQLSEPYGEVALSVAGSGEPVVLLHGVGMQSAAWEPQIATLAKSHHVIALDMPGHGGSAPLPSSAKLPEFVSWLAAVLDALDLGAVNLAGHSMGALVASGLAVLHPKKVRRLALLNGVFRRSVDARAAVMARANQIREGAFDLETPLARWFGDGVNDQAASAQVAGWLSEVNIDGYATAYSAFACGDAIFADRFGEIACPVLTLTGDGDVNSSPEMSRVMAGAVQNGRAIVLDGHRHMLNLTAPEQVNEILLDWLSLSVSGGDND
ncbi:alpha/beta fold hydrolase [Shimia sp. R11_0]|uniref:alpha/beta fold hydrolase n=1 Tax=Shimia sp. R11_0 TaxID=2821096 RepID=UPI001ADAC871|nr:alpha/beta hydrolase [Shimia sp. R11_0]MBO9479385.1 alpha/beta fold hydrolase [Shimia sp. R11_0]